jgi:hypothetical protein
MSDRRAAADSGHGYPMRPGMKRQSGWSPPGRSDRGRSSARARRVPGTQDLESHGLLRRERRPDDERSVRITLTSAGTELHAKAGDTPSFMATRWAWTPPSPTSSAHCCGV